MIKIANSCCLDFLRSVCADSVDLVVTDPPYRVVQGGRVGDSTPRGGIFGESLDFKSGKIFKHNEIKFQDWLPEVWRVLKNGTHCIIMINGRNLKELQQAAENTGFQYLNLLVWDKGNKTPNRYYMQQLEFILLLRKGPAKNIANMGHGNLISIKNQVGKKGHPTEKPVELFDILIRNSSKEWDTVLDPFMGSGNCGVASLCAGRKFIGCEIDDIYFKAAENKIYNTLGEFTL